MFVTKKDVWILYIETLIKKIENNLKWGIPIASTGHAINKILFIFLMATNLKGTLSSPHHRWGSLELGPPPRGSRW